MYRGKGRMQEGAELILFSRALHRIFLLDKAYLVLDEM